MRFIMRPDTLSGGLPIIKTRQDKITFLIHETVDTSPPALVQKQTLRNPTTDVSVHMSS